MGDIISLQNHRLGLEAAPIQDGVDMVAGYLGQEPPVINAAHDGYFMTADYANGQFSIGKDGVADFRAGFHGVFEEETEPTAELSAGIAYGAYSIGRILIPDVIASDPDQWNEFEQLVDTYASRYPQAEFPAVAELITAQAAATLAIIGLHKVFKEQDAASRAAFAKRVNMKHFPPSQPAVAGSFKHRMDERLLLRLLGKPIRQVHPK